MDRQTLFGLAAGAALLASAATPARACAPAYPEGKSVAIASEAALIVWDAAAGVEHFIRRADFRTDAEDFGFLVPTPSPPELSEVDGAVFGRLASHIAPPIEYKHTYEPVTLCTAPFLMFLGGAESEPIAASAAAGVEILATAEVAGMDATVVRADDAEVLAGWLEERGYENRPALVAWLAPYVRDGFAITAFQFRKAAATDAGVRGRAVRMSFETDRPFYPYREPLDHPEAWGRTLGVHVVASARAFPSIGDDAADAEWSGELRYAAPLEDAAGLLGDSLGDRLGELEGPLVLSSFVDTAASREDHDLRFDVRAGEVVRPAPIVRPGGPRLVPLPVELVAIVAGFWWWRRRKRRAAAEA